jgi:hypothetical protein
LDLRRMPFITPLILIARNYFGCNEISGIENFQFSAINNITFLTIYNSFLGSNGQSGRFLI